MVTDNLLLKKIETNLTWRNLLLDKTNLGHIKKLELWLNSRKNLNEKKSFSLVLFYGNSNDDRELTAKLLGKYTDSTVYRIDLSSIISKYIGETEKNIDRLFEEAKNNDSILFFDEADALFGKRTNVQNAHDKYANQETSYLLQSIEKYSGVVILSTNSIKNVDKALIKNFDSIIEFKKHTLLNRKRICFGKYVNRILGLK